MKRILALAGVLVAAATLLAQQPQAPPGRPAPDVKEAKYGPHERNVLDLWQAKAEKPTPFVVFIHGGGFQAGSKENLNPGFLTRCLAAGLSVAAINYRYSRQAPFPGPMLDSARAVQYLRSRAAEWNLDPGRVACTGGSAGAGISLWLAFHDDLADPKSEDPVLRQSSRLTCAAVTGAQCSYDPRWIKEHIGGRAHEHPALLPFYGLKADELETEKAYALFAEASPLTHLTKDDPPVWMVYGGNDKPSDRPGAGIHSEKFGYELKAAMEKLGLACEVVIQGSGDVAGEVAFLVKHLQGK